MYSFVGRRSTTAETTAAAAAHLGVTTYVLHVFSHIRTRYFSEGSVQLHASYSFRKRVLLRPVMKRLFFPWKPKEKKARFARAPHDNTVLTGPTIYTVCHPAFLRALQYVRLTVSLFFFFKNLGFTRACWRSFGITSYLPQPPIVYASSSIDKHSSQLSTAGIRQQTAAAPTSQQQHSK